MSSTKKANYARMLDAQARTVFVGGLQEKNAQVLNELREFFSEWEIEDISLELQRPPYAAFIVLKNLEDCQAFVDEYDGVKLPSRGWILRVQRKKGAREKEEEAELKSAAVRLRAQQAATEGSGGRICWAVPNTANSTSSGSNGTTGTGESAQSSPATPPRHVSNTAAANGSATSANASPVALGSYLAITPDTAGPYNGSGGAGRYGVDAKAPQRDPMRLWVEQLERAARAQHQSLEQRFNLIFQMVHNPDTSVHVQTQLLKSVETIAARAYNDLGAVLDQIMFAPPPGSGSPGPVHPSLDMVIVPPSVGLAGSPSMLTPRVLGPGPVRNLAASFAAIGAPSSGPSSSSSPPPPHLHHPQPIHPVQVGSLSREGSFGSVAAVLGSDPVKEGSVSPLDAVTLAGSGDNSLFVNGPL